MAAATKPPAARRNGLAAAIVAVAGGLVLATAAGPVAMHWNWRAGAKLGPFDWQVQSAAARQAIAAKDGASAIASAYRAIIANPLDARTLTIIGATRAGTAGTRLLNQSAALGWRDPLTNFRLIDQAIRERDPVVAAQRADAVGRTLGAARVARFADRILLMPGGVEAMAERASRHLGPGWMPDWMATPARDPAVAAARSALVGRIENADGPWKRLMIRSAGAGFEAGGAAPAYFELWRASLADPALIDGVIYDGNFSQPLETDTLIGEWQIVPDSSVRAERGEGEGLRMTAGAGGLGSILVQTGPARPALVLEARWNGSRDFPAATAWRYMCRDSAQSASARQTLSREGAEWVQRADLALPSGCRLGSIWLDLVRPVAPGVAGTLVRVDAR